MIFFVDLNSMFPIQTSADSNNFELINYLTTTKKELIDDLKGDVAPVDGSSSTLTVPLVEGKNVVKVKVTGQDPPFTGKTSTDRDTLTIFRGP